MLQIQQKMAVNAGTARIGMPGISTDFDINGTGTTGNNSGERILGSTYCTVRKYGRKWLE